MQDIADRQNFDSYWLSFLSAHHNTVNRLCHYIGTIIWAAGGLGGFMFVSLQVGCIFVLLGFGIALLGHLVFERNLPYVTQPHLAIFCEFLMLYLYMFDRSRLNQDLSRVHPSS